jgi:hypothetical protein
LTLERPDEVDVFDVFLSHGLDQLSLDVGRVFAKGFGVRSQVRLAVEEPANPEAIRPDDDKIELAVGKAVDTGDANRGSDVERLGGRSNFPTPTNQRDPKAAIAGEARLDHVPIAFFEHVQRKSGTGKEHGTEWE